MLVSLLFVTHAQQLQKFIVWQPETADPSLPFHDRREDIRQVEPQCYAQPDMLFKAWRLDEMNRQPKTNTVSAEAVFISDRERLIEIACRVVESRAIAEEIVQESWLRWHKQNYKPAEARPIFRRIVANLAIDWYRGRRTENGVVSDIYAMRSYAPSTETAVIARDELTIIVKTLLSMSKRHVKAFRMRTVDGKKYKEIAEELDVSVGFAFRLIEQVMVEIYLALDP